MKFEIRELLNSFRQEIANAKTLPFCPAIKIVSKYTMLQYLDKIYACLPDDVVKARKYLEDRQVDLQSLPKCDNLRELSIYDNLRELEMFLSLFPFSIYQYIVIKAPECEELLSKIENNIPKEILKVENIDK